MSAPLNERCDWPPLYTVRRFSKHLNLFSLLQNSHSLVIIRKSATRTYNSSVNLLIFRIRHKMEIWLYQLCLPSPQQTNRLEDPALSSPSPEVLPLEETYCYDRNFNWFTWRALTVNFYRGWRCNKHTTTHLYDNESLLMSCYIHPRFVYFCCRPP